MKKEVIVYPDRQRLSQAIRRKGFVIVSPREINIPRALREARADFLRSWERLEPDTYVTDGSRQRRYGRFRIQSDEKKPQLLPHQKFRQARAVNSEYGGEWRDFAALEAEIHRNRFLQTLVLADFKALPLPSEDRGKPWEVGIHQIRILARPEQPGDPTPEGIHQDGFDYLWMHLMKRTGRRATTTLYDAKGHPLEQVTLNRPMESIGLDDVRLKHATGLFRVAKGSRLALRDILVLTFHPIER